MEKKYPIGGYAPGNYRRLCYTCKVGFDGDKRAIQCEPCAVADLREKLKPYDQQATPQGIGWVKASTRLPKKHIDVIVRNIKTGHVKRTRNFGHNTGWDVSMDIEFKWDNTEWLDETGQSQQPGREEWISVDERLPTEGGRYWCYVEEITDLGRGYFQWNCAFNQNGRLFTDKSLCNGERITHWRPLPEPPKKNNPIT